MCLVNAFLTRFFSAPYCDSGSQKEFALQDIVLLQEVFTRADVSQLSDSAKAGKLKHSHFFHGGMLQGELLLLSAYSIYEV